jgi:hypothetical protein
MVSTKIRTSAALIALVILGAGGCSVHEHALEDGGTPSCSQTSSSAALAAACPIKTGGSLCASVPKYTGTQVVDGVDDDFCDVTATVFELRKGATFFGQAPPTVLDVMTARVAWDAAGIHAHFHVDDPVLVRDSRSDSWAGPDYIELDIGGTFPLVGFYDGEQRDRGLMNIFMNPESALTPIKGFTGAVPAQATMGFVFPQGGNYGLERTPLTDLAKWAYRTVAGGYEFELFLPWALLGRATPPASGTTIALDLGFGTNNDPNYWSFWPSAPQLGTPGTSGQTFLAIRPLPSGTTTSCAPLQPTNALPWCDDRTWCQPTLE